jgi:uncharacterized protein YbbK (DUF523 family)/uncharacterized protein YbgA (DUF1722 family)
MSKVEYLPVRIGVSSCLLGAEVRYDGGHKLDLFLVRELGHFVEWVPVCPELEVGMGVPREPVRLQAVRGPASQPPLVKMLGTRSGIDWTDTMESYSTARTKALEELELSGYVLKSRSPSCGMERVPVYGEGGTPWMRGPGLFAAALLERMPALPVEEEGRLNDARLRENFIERVFCRHRWLLFRRQRFSPARLGEFHRRHKFLLLAHSETSLRRLGRVAASAKGRPADETAAEYERLFFDALAVLPTVKSHTNVLQHMAGFFKEQLDPGDMRELHDAIDSFRRGHLPRLVPLTLIRHHLRRLLAAYPKLSYIDEQYYLAPHPTELLLRFHA